MRAKLVNPKDEPIRKKLRPEDITAVIDTREQTPLVLAPLKVEYGTLKTGDYSVLGLESKICIERKALQDMIMCCGKERDRFERELDRMKAFKYRAIAVEGDWSQIEMKTYRGTMHPNAIMGTLLAWAMSAQVPIMMLGSHERCGRFVSRMLYIAAQREHRKATNEARHSDVASAFAENAARSEETEKEIKSAVGFCGDS